MPHERKAGDFGTRLREARERKGVTLREIANVTRISVRALEALERNDISRLPGGLFSRAFVRSYAAQIGLDPEATVEDFVRHFPHDSVTAGHPKSSSVDDGESFESDRRIATITLRIVGISVVIAGLVVYFTMSGRRVPVADPSSSASARAAVPAASTDPAERLSVEVTALRAVTVSASIDDQPSVDLQLEPASRRTFDVLREITLKVDDPSAIDWSINGASGRSLGAPGEPSVVRVTLDNYRTFQNVR